MKELQWLLIPKDPNDEKNCSWKSAGRAAMNPRSLRGIIQNVFAVLPNEMAWRIEIMENHPSEVGGYKEIIHDEGDRVFSKLKYELGVHRVQRVLQTEANGRIHTSAVTIGSA